MAEQPEKVVVLHTLVNDWPQGSVIERRQLVFPDPRGGDHPDHDAYDRLVAAGAVRPLREGEEGLARVPLPAAGLSTEAQLRLGGLDAQIDQLTRAVSSLQERLAFHQTAGAAPAALVPEEDPAVAAAIAERQSRLEHLTRTAEALAARLDEAQGTTRARDEAAGKAAQEARGGREMPSGAAPPYTPGGGPPQVEQPASPASPPVEGAAPPPEPHGRGRHRRGAGEGE